MSIQLTATETRVVITAHYTYVCPAAYQYLANCSIGNYGAHSDVINVPIIKCRQRALNNKVHFTKVTNTLN